MNQSLAGPENKSRLLRISTLYIDRDVQNSPVVRSICERFNLPKVMIDNPQTVYKAVGAAADPVGAGKKVLYLTRNKGAFIKQCPGTRQYNCCGYKILHIGTYCHMDCSYCIMQSYFHPPVLQFFVNHTDMFSELDALFATPEIHRIGTGEYTDSLIWEPRTSLSAHLIQKFADQDHAVLELKTKTTAVEGLGDLRHRRRTIISWSLNTPSIIAREERSTATLEARLQAAARCEARGYPLAFHFDPMLIYPGCENDYREVVRQLFTRVSPTNIVWISIGTFRFMPALKNIVARRFPASKIIYGEFIPGLDGKMRYFKPLRIDLYKKMFTWIKAAAPDVLVYFCMEDDAVWQETMGFSPEEKGGLSRMLDQSAIKHCGLVT